MNLKNYTSSTPANITISYIEAYLADCGVTGITKQYDNGVPVAIFFHIEIPNSGRYTIRLPAQVEKVLDYLWRDYCSHRVQPRKERDDFKEQAARTAWKIQQDWVQVQMSLIKLKQVDFLEVFMGFLWDGKKSYYQSLVDSKFKQLPASASS
jgi:hypothetical protein